MKTCADQRIGSKRRESTSLACSLSMLSCPFFLLASGWSLLLRPRPLNHAAHEQRRMPSWSSLSCWGSPHTHTHTCHSLQSPPGLPPPGLPKTCARCSDAHSPLQVTHTDTKHVATLRRARPVSRRPPDVDSNSTAPSTIVPWLGAKRPWNPPPCFFRWIRWVSSTATKRPQHGMTHQPNSFNLHHPH